MKFSRTNAKMLAIERQLDTWPELGSCYEDDSFSGPPTVTRMPEATTARMKSCILSSCEVHFHSILIVYFQLHTLFPRECEKKNFPISISCFPIKLAKINSFHVCVALC
eukprot:g41614.t1